MVTQLVVWMNGAANGMARVLLAPIAWLPGWVSATIVAAVTGVLMLLVFKYTSNQEAIRRTRNQIKANLLALALFKDSMRVSLTAQGRILLAAGRLITLSLVPMLVMLVPMSLLLGQLALWYQARPLHVGESAVVTVHFAPDAAAALDQCRLATGSPVQVTVGPVRVPAEQMVCWSVESGQAGCHTLTFECGGQRYDKELSVGNGFLPTSLQRPAWRWADVLLHPHEQPLPRESPVQAIEIAYPQRNSWTSGTNNWVVYWFAISLVAALAVRPLLKVNL